MKHDPSTEEMLNHDSLCDITIPTQELEALNKKASSSSGWLVFLITALLVGCVLVLLK